MFVIENVVSFGLVIFLWCKEVRIWVDYYRIGFRIERIGCLLLNKEGGKFLVRIERIG